MLRFDSRSRRALAAMARATHPVILLGDLNAPPEADELQPLFRRPSDAWVDAGKGSDPSGLTYPAEAPTKRIDYVLVSPDVTVLSVEVVPTDASDHRAVVTVLELPER